MPTLLHVTTTGSTLRFLRSQLIYMKKKGFEVHVASSPGPELIEFASSEGVHPHELPLSRRVSPVADLRALLSMLRLIRRIRPTIIHAHTPKAGLIGMLAGSLSRIPVRVYHVHGLPLETRIGWMRSVLWGCEWLSCHCSHQVLAVSPSLSARIRSLRISRVCHVIGSGSVNGIDAENEFSPARFPLARNEVRERLGIADDEYVVGFVGRLAGDKGLKELVEAFEGIAEVSPRARLLAVGPWDEADPVSISVRRRLEGNDRVILTGRDWNVAPLYLAMDVLAVPSYREGFGMAALEASAMGLPVVVSRVTGLVDAVVDGQTGTVVSPRDIRALRDALLLYHGNRLIRERHGLAGRSRALASFRREPIWEELASRYRDLLRHHNGQAGC